MLIDGGKIKEVKIKLFLSSRSEMQKVIETARAQSLTMQTFMQMPPAQITTNPIPATQIPPTPTQTTPVLPTQMPMKTTAPDIKPLIPPLPIENPPSEQIKSEFEAEKKDQDTESVSSKDAKRSRRGRSVSKSKSRDRSKSRERSRSRSRDRNYRNKDRYRDRRRRDRSRSRDRRDRRRHRDRSRSRDRSSGKSSRDKKRDSDRNDRNSSESNSNNVKSSTTIPDKEVKLPTPPLPTSKPGFTNSGWVAAGATEKPSNLSFTNPIGFSIGKQTDNSSVSNEPLQRKNEESTTKQIPLPQQVPQPSSISHSMLLPQPPPFPQLQLEVSKDEGGINRPLTFPPSQQSNAMPTQHANSLYMPNQPQMLQNESNKLIHQPGPLMMPPGWNPSMLPPMVNNPHMLLGPMPPIVGMNSSDKMHMPMMNAPPVMYNRPPTLLSNDKIQSPHLQNDPRMQPGFNMQQPRNNDERDNIHAKHINNFGLQKQSSFAEGGLHSTNLRSSFLNSSVEVRNMAMNTTIIDIRRFFQGLEIPEDGIKIITDKKGNKVGMAYVRFSKPIFKEMAVRKSGKILKNSAVEILHIEDNIFDKATDFSDYQGRFFKDNQNYKNNYNDFMELKEPSEIFTDLIIHEVPPFSKDREIYNLFKEFNIEDAFVLLRTGRKTATGYVRFRTPAEARRALITSSRLTIGYNNVKAAICYEHEFNDARDRKNMEEEEEEDIMDTKDTGYPPYENRNPRNLMKYTPYDREQDGPETRYNQNDKRSHGHKTLLPTPNTKIFDPRSVYSNQSTLNNFNSRFDRRQQDHASRIPREDFNKKPNIREDFHQKPFPRESSRFQGRTASRDDFNENHRSMGDANRKSQPYKAIDNDFQAQSKKLEITQNPVNVPKTNLEKSTLDSKVSLDKPIIPEGVKKETLIEKNISNEVDIGNIPDIKPTLKSIPETSQSVIPPPELKEEVIVQKENDLKQSKENQHSSQNREIQRPMDFETDCIILRGLPFNANDRDILDFFSDEGLAPTQIHIMLNKLGQPAGDAFCEFNTVEEVHRALTKNRTLMGRSVVAVEPVPREEMMSALDIVVPLRHHVVNPVEECPESFQNSDYQRQDYRFPPRGRGFQNFPPRGRGRGGFRGRHHVPLNLEQETQNVNSFGKPGCVVALENVPFRAEVQDIIDFFGRYFVSRDNVIRRFDENGKPTGDARVCLSSPEDANHAVRTLNQRHLFNRQIHLSLV